MASEFVGTAAPLTKAGFDTAVNEMKLKSPAALWALLAVETRGFGYLPDKRPKILFERHKFHKRTGGKFDAQSDISSPASGGYSKDEDAGAGEYDRLSRAIALDRNAALESASWGLGQVMGFNATKLKYDSAEDMVKRFMADEDKQLDGVVRFMNANLPLLKALQNQNWTSVAFFYNGAEYKKNAYDTRLQKFFDLYSLPGHAPDIETRANQARLAYLDFDPGGIDGMMGSNTRAAIVSFQKKNNIVPSGEFDTPTAAKLKALTGV